MVDETDPEWSWLTEEQAAAGEMHYLDVSEREIMACTRGSSSIASVEKALREAMRSTLGQMPADERAMVRITKERVHEALQGETIVRRQTIQIVLLAAIGPEPWDIIYTTGKKYGGIGKAGRILIVIRGGDARDPLAGLAYSYEYGRPFVHHVWVDEDARKRGLSQVLFAAYRSQVSEDLVVAGPFTAAGRAAALRAGAKLEEE